MKKIGHYVGLTKANSFVFCSGQVGIEKVSGTIAVGIERQTQLAIEQLEALLSSEGLTLGSIVKTTVYLIDEGDYDDMDTAYRESFKGHVPARTTVIVKSLPKTKDEGPELIRFEIDAVAYAPES